MLGKKLGVDLGTATVRVLTRGEGTVFAEPSVVAIREGEPSMSMLGAAALEAAADDRTLQLRHPLRHGDVVDERALLALVHHTVNRAVGRQRIFKPDLVIAVRGGMSGDDRRAVLDAAARAGSRTVYLIDAAIAAAMGAELPISSSRAHLVVDLGAGKTDCAVLALEGTVASRSLLTGSENMFDRVAGHVTAVHGVELSRSDVHGVARLLVAAPHEERTGEVGGVLLSSHELAPIVSEHLAALDEAITSLLDETPPALRREVIANGLVLTGGGSRLEGLERHLAAVAGCSVRTAPEPETCAVRGTALAVDNLDVLKRNFMYIR